MPQFELSQGISQRYQLQLCCLRKMFPHTTLFHRHCYTPLQLCNCHVSILRHNTYSSHLCWKQSPTTLPTGSWPQLKSAWAHSWCLVIDAVAHPEPPPAVPPVLAVQTSLRPAVQNTVANAPMTEGQLLHQSSTNPVQFKMVSMRSEKPICAPPPLSEVSPMLPLKQFQSSQCWMYRPGQCHTCHWAQHNSSTTHQQQNTSQVIQTVMHNHSLLVPQHPLLLISQLRSRRK